MMLQRMIQQIDPQQLQQLIQQQINPVPQIAQVPQIQQLQQVNYQLIPNSFNPNNNNSTVPSSSLVSQTPPPVYQPGDPRASLQSSGSAPVSGSAGQNPMDVLQSLYAQQQILQQQILQQQLQTSPQILAQLIQQQQQQGNGLTGAFYTPTTPQPQQQMGTNPPGVGFPGGPPLPPPQ